MKEVFDIFDNVYLGDGISLHMNTKNQLILHSKDGKQKIIGDLAYDIEGTIEEYFKEEKTKDIFRKADAFGFPEYIIKNLPDECNVIVHARGPKDDKRCGLYYTTAETIRREGFILHFKQKGYEKRIYLKRKFFLKR